MISCLPVKNMPASNPIMKALDHVVLWYARGFAAMLLPFFFYVWLHFGLVLYSTLRLVHWRWNESFNLIIELTVVLIALVLLNISLWFPHKILARFYLIAIGLYFFLGDGVTASMTAITWNGPIWKMMMAISVLGLASTLWVAIRPHHNSFLSHPLPQSC